MKNGFFITFTTFLFLLLSPHLAYANTPDEDPSAQYIHAPLPKSSQVKSSAQHFTAGRPLNFTNPCNRFRIF